MRKVTKGRIHEAIYKAIKDGTTAGASLLVIQDGKELFYDEQGWADVENNVPIQRDTIFRLYSMSKPITAAAVMILVERGRLDLAEPVENYLEGFARMQVEKNGVLVPAVKPMLPLYLLNMTAGLTYGDPLTIAGQEVLSFLEECTKKLRTPQEVTTLEFANALGKLPLAYEPDTSWSYGLGADVLGALVEKITGERFGDFLQESIFRPLEMKDTGFWVPEESQNRLAKTYETVGPGQRKLYEGDDLLIRNRADERPAFESGGAGLVSTIDDYAHFAQMLLNGGEFNGKRILSERTAAFLTSGGLTPAQQREFRNWCGLEGFTYSHLMRIMTKSPGMASTLTRPGEYGWDGALGCYFANFPADNMTLILMQQKRNAGTIPMTRKIRNILLSDCEI